MSGEPQSARPLSPPRHQHGVAARTVGLDVGASLCKIALYGETLETAHYSSVELDTVRSRIRHFHPRHIVATGGGAAELGEDLAGTPIRQVSEFDAWARGCEVLARESGQELSRAYLLVSLGTGTSALGVRSGDGGAHSVERVAGSALGGGTLLGLGQALLGSRDFPELADLASNGDRRNVDLLVGDIYRGGGISLHPELNAASFGKLAPPRSREARPEDLAHALMGLVGENVGIICAVAARAFDLDPILYCGSTLTDNPSLRETLELVSFGLGRRPVFLEGGAYCGAVGAAALTAAG